MAASTVLLSLHWTLRVLAWLPRHLRWCASWLIVGVLANLAGAVDVLVLAVAAVAVPALVSTLWAHLRPVSFERWVAGPWRRVCWRWWLHRSWPALTQATGLGRHRTVRRRERDGTRREVQVWTPTGVKVHAHELGLSLEVRTPLGLTVGQVLDAGEALAAAAGAASVRTRRLSPGQAVVELTMVDALSVPRSSAEPGPFGPVLLGRCEDGTVLLWDPITDVHLALQGMTRSGKSATAYTLLSALAARSDVVVCGVDPSGLLLGPWTAGRGAGWIATGTADMRAAVTALGAVVAEMDARIRQLHHTGRDKLDAFDATTPVLVVVLEEWPGALAAARCEDDAAGRTGSERVAPAIERAAGRLFKEGAKVGIRVVTIAQRMSAKALDTDDRSNISHRLTLRVDNGDSVRMLHDGVSVSLDEVRAFAPGCALAETPAGGLQRARMDFTSYGTYLRRVSSGIAAVATSGPTVFAATKPRTQQPADDFTPAPDSTQPQKGESSAAEMSTQVSAPVSPLGPGHTVPVERPARPRQAKRPRPRVGSDAG